MLWVNQSSLIALLHTIKKLLNSSYPKSNNYPPFNSVFPHIFQLLFTVANIEIQNGKHSDPARHSLFLHLKKPGKAFNLGKINGWSSDYRHLFIPSVTRAECVCARQLCQSTSNSGPSVKRRWGPSLRETNDLSHVIDHLPMGHLSFLCLARRNPPPRFPSSPVAWWRQTAGECRQIVEMCIYVGA